jgi:hypothetical protein
MSEESKAFADFPGEDPERTAAHVAAMEVDLAGRVSRGDPTEDVERELERFGVTRRDAVQRRPGRPRSTRSDEAGDE